MSSQVLLQKLILKKKYEDHESLFETERQFYENAKELQERGLVPQYHGLASIDGSPALVLSDLGGTMLHDQPSLSLDEDTLRGNLKELLGAIRRTGVVHDDISLLNVLHCADNRLRLIDFEMVKIDQPVDEAALEYEVGMEVDDLVRYLKRRQKAQEEREARRNRGGPLYRWNTLSEICSTAAPGVH